MNEKVLKLIELTSKLSEVKKDNLYEKICYYKGGKTIEFEFGGNRFKFKGLSEDFIEFKSSFMALYWGF